GNVDLQNRFLFAFTRHRERYQQRWKQREAHSEDSRTDVLIGILTGIEPVSNLRLNRRRGVRYVLSIESLSQRRGITTNNIRCVCVGAVDEPLNIRRLASP